MDDEDRSLVARAVASQDSAAFGELIRRHQSQVRNFLRKLTRDAALSDDLAQETFLRAWNKLHTFSGRGSFIGWLLRIAYTTFLQSRRRSKRYAEVLDEVRQVERSQSGNYRPESDEIPDLARFLAVLTEEERAVMVLSYGCGLSHGDIAEATGLPIGTVKSILFRGKEKIRTCFEIGDQHYDRRAQRR